MPSSATVDLDSLLARITADYPDLTFIESAHFAWNSGQKSIAFKKSPHGSDSSDDTIKNIFALLHELGHAILGHKNYIHDIQLLQMEVAAWDEARALASLYGVTMDENYIEDCLDTYRDWLHLRATCPTCFARSLQSSEKRYSCLNCQTEWRVSRSRLCRPYRLQTA